MAPRYGDFKFDSSAGFTGSVKRKPFKRGGYAEGGMRSERTQVAKASRDVQDNAMAPAKQLNKSLKNLYNTRKQTGYESDEPQGYSKGGPKKLTPGEDPRQMLLGDIQPVTQKERLNAAAAKPMRGSANQKSSDDLFRPLEPDMIDLMKKKKGGKVAKMASGGGFLDALRSRMEQSPIYQRINKRLHPSSQMSIGSESGSGGSTPPVTPTKQAPPPVTPSVKPVAPMRTDYETGTPTRNYEMPNVPTMKKGGKVGYAGGGLHKMRSDKGVTGEVPAVKMGRRSTKIPGMLAPMNAGPKIKNPTSVATSSPLSNIALKRGGKAKK